jgi:hypothetical protein
MKRLLKLALNSSGLGFLSSRAIKEFSDLVSKERNMSIIAERYIFGLIKIHGLNPVSTDEGGTWYPLQACQFLKLKYNNSISFAMPQAHSSYSG